MAKIGLNNFRYAIIKALDVPPEYDEAKKPGKAVSAKVSVKTNSAELHADDCVAESDTSFSGGDIELEVDRDDPATLADLLGHAVEYVGADGETTTADGDWVGVHTIRNADDKAPYVGVARIVRKMVDGELWYKAECLYKVKFSEPSQDEETKGENLSFKTTTITGIISTLDNGDWSDSYESKDRASVEEFITKFFSR